MNNEYVTAKDRTNQNNQRINERVYPSQQLQSYFSTRPVNTKFTVFPIGDQRKQSQVKVNQMPTYDSNLIFNPGKGPWSGFSSNINKESELRNQIYAIQCCSQAKYIPSSKSNMYQVHWNQNNKIKQPFPDLFKNENFDKVNPNPNSELIGYAIFNNSTRQQNKELKC